MGGKVEKNKRQQKPDLHTRMMPEMDGFENGEKIKIHPWSSQNHVLALNAGKRARNMIKGLEFVDEYIANPFIRNTRQIGDKNWSAPKERLRNMFQKIATSQGMPSGIFNQTGIGCKPCHIEKKSDPNLAWRARPWEIDLDLALTRRP